MSNKREKYEAPELEIIRFKTEDVITTSLPSFYNTVRNETELSPWGTPQDKWHLGL